MFAITILSWSASSFADEQDTFNLSVERSHQYDSNLFRLPDEASSVPSLISQQKSEKIGVTSAAFSLEKSYSLQHFQLKTSIVDYEYRNFRYLSFTSLNYGAAWQWSFTPRLNGILSSSRVEIPTNYRDFKAFDTRNVHTDIVTHFEAEANVGGAWRILAGLDQLTSQEEQFAVREGDSSTQSAAAGVRYIFSSGNILTYRIRNGHGESIGLTDASTVGRFDFNDRAHELDMKWALSGKTKINARLGHTNRTYGDVTQRDFSGITGGVMMQWEPTAKTSVEISVQRALVPYLISNSNYIKLNRFSVAPVWKASSRIDVRARYEIALRDFDGITPHFVDNIGRRDTIRVASLGLVWQPVRAAYISLTLQKIKNSSNVGGAGYTSNGANVAAKFTF